MRSVVDIETDLAAARGARLSILRGGQSVSAGDGASRSHASLAEVDRTIRGLEAELALTSGSGGGIGLYPTMGGG